MIFVELRKRLDSGQARLVALKVVLLISAVFVFNNFDSQHRFTAALKNWGHVAVFFLASHLLLELLRGWIGSRRQRLLGIVLICLGIGAGIELIQPYFGRDRSLIDLIYDGIGIIAALLFHLAHETRKWWLRGLGGAVLIISTCQPVYYGTMALARSWAVPYLAGFEQFWEKAIWQAQENSSAQIERNPSGGYWLSVKMQRGAYPGVSFPEIHPNWQGYSSLALRMFSPQKETISLTLRIHDQEHNNDYNDRFNQRLSIQPDINDLVIPLHDVASAPQDRRMDLSQIQNLMLFAVSPEQPLTIYIDEIRLLE